MGLHQLRGLGFMIVLYVSDHLLTTHCSPLIVMLSIFCSLFHVFPAVIMITSFIGCAPITSTHARSIYIIRSSCDPRPHSKLSRWQRTLNSRTCRKGPKRWHSLLPRLTLMTPTEPLLPGRWPRSSCASHPLIGIVRPVAHTMSRVLGYLFSLGCS